MSTETVLKIYTILMAAIFAIVPIAFVIWNEFLK